MSMLLRIKYWIYVVVAVHHRVFPTEVGGFAFGDSQYIINFCSTFSGFLRGELPLLFSSLSCPSFFHIFIRVLTATSINLKPSLSSSGPSIFASSTPSYASVSICFVNGTPHTRARCANARQKTNGKQSWHRPRQSTM